MINLSELKRRLDNVVRWGVVTQTKMEEGEAFVKVSINKRVTDWMKVKMYASKFMRHWKPICVGDQVIVLHPFGNGDHGIVFPSFFWQKIKPPKGATKHIEILEYKCGGRVEIDVKECSITVKGWKKLNIEVEQLNLKGDLITDGDIKTNGTITDSMGDLTHFTTTDGAKRA